MIDEMTSKDLKQRITELEKENKLLKAELEERELIMETLHDSEQHLYAMVSCVPGVVYRLSIDKEWALKYISDEISNITKYPISHFMLKNIKNYRDIIHHDDVENVNKIIRQKIEEKDIEPFLIEYRIIDAEDHIRWCSEKGHVFFNNSGIPLYLDGTIFDITNLKAAEENLKAANRELEKLASIDELTRIANRRYFLERLEMEWKRMRREKGFLSIILCDIDYFKLFNDNYGHQEGDKCLYAVSQAIQSALRRPADLVSRFGGEEFIIILPNTDIKGAFSIAEHIRLKVLELKMSHQYSTAEKYVSLSIGVACCIPNPDIEPDSIIKTADMALYEAKKQGRNQVVSSQ